MICKLFFEQCLAVSSSGSWRRPARTRLTPAANSESSSILKIAAAKGPPVFSTTFRRDNSTTHAIRSVGDSICIVQRLGVKRFCVAAALVRSSSAEGNNAETHSGKDNPCRQHAGNEHNTDPGSELTESPLLYYHSFSDNFSFSCSCLLSFSAFSVSFS